MNHNDSKLEENYKSYFRIFNDLLTRNFNPMKKISIESINNIAAIESEYFHFFKEFGFKTTYKKIELWKKFV